MASLLEKVQILLSADLNRLVDRALQSNETAVFQGHIRELQGMQEQLDAQLLSLQADLAGMRRRNEEQQAIVVQQDQEVDSLLRMGLQEDALAAQDRLNQSRTLAANLTAQLERLESQYRELADTKARLDARIAALVHSEPEVSGLVEVARARRLGEQADARLDDLAGAGEVPHDADTARTVGAIRNRLAAAEAQIQQLEPRALQHGETPDVLKRKELEDQIAARKARLGLAEPAAPDAPPAAGTPPAPDAPSAPESK